MRRRVTGETVDVGGRISAWGIIVNYRYDPDRIEENLEAFAEEGRIDTAPWVRRQAKGRRLSGNP